MTKWEVYRENGIEAKKGGKEWSVQNMLDFRQGKDDFKELIGSFDTKEEAKALFESEKETCSSYYEEGYVFDLVLFDYISLEENEYDEDDEFIENLGIWDEYITPLELYHVRYGTGVGDFDVDGELDAAKEKADENATYTQCDIVIEDKSEDRIAYRTWYGVPYDENDEDKYCDNPIVFGTFGYYGDWQED